MQRQKQTKNRSEITPLRYAKLIGACVNASSVDEKTRRVS